ncbi:HU family DNA-binding protein (plasmid) [Moritella sp. 24]|uniref:HU family DNA-binding protein n=1 Tax=Moritella sp. 24 TaxID=2746230 RepID=UPI001BA83B2E|nr:HU family DNA-binding protein [Moritella sp. 24]QUM78748.1 HU family DNA-binding protein [Moritella sp. 24]
MIKNKEVNTKHIDKASLTSWTKESIVNEVFAPVLNLTAEQSMNVLESIVACIKGSLVMEHSVLIPRAGTLVVSHKSERPGRNPKTGEPHKISSRNVVTLAKKGRGKTCRINRSDMFALVYLEQPNVDQKQIDLAVRAFYQLIADVKQGEHRIEIRDFGSFTPVISGERMGRNPKTGEKVIVSERMGMHFQHSRQLRSMVNQYM